MPEVKRQRSHTRDLARRRWLQENMSQESVESSNGEGQCRVDLDDDNDFMFSNEFVLNDIVDLFSFCKERINIRFISVLIYVSLRYFGHSWRDVDEFLRSIGATIAG